MFSHLALALLAGCCKIDPADYRPVERDDWEVSTPEAEGLDPDAVNRLYCDASRRSELYSVLVVKNGKLVAEAYFNEGHIDEHGKRASVTKSYLSAMVGAALEDGCLGALDQPMLDSFPDVVDDITDPRKFDITARHLLKMRSGYPWEEAYPEIWEEVWTGDLDHMIAEIPLEADPGTVHHYSNFGTHWLGKVVAISCDTDLATFGREQLFDPLGVVLQGWTQDVDGYYIGMGDIEFTARDMARFGQLYLDDGAFEGEQILPADWVYDSLRPWSTEPEPDLTPGGPFEDWEYGYLWWAATAGDRHVDFAWGHGGNFIFLVRELELMVVLTANPWWGEPSSSEQWRHEKAHMDLAGEFFERL
jgi:CubicO group peptidase (beta-lactamase class C family)